MEIELCWAYNRWLTEKALPEADGRFYSMLCLPLSEPDEALRQIETFGDRKGVDRLPGHLGAHHAGASQRQHEGLSRASKSAGWRSPSTPPSIRRAGVQEPQPLRLGACARLPVLQHPARDQLGHQRARRALPEAAGDLDRRRARLDAVPDAAARSRVHAARRRNIRC